MPCNYIMNIGIDIDGVLADFPGNLEAEYNKRFGTHYPPGFFGYSRAQWPALHEIPENMATLFHDPEYSRNIAVIPGATKALQVLSQSGFALCIVTHRLSAPELTKAWLHTHFGDTFAKIIFCSGIPKGKVCRQHDINILIDDDPLHLENLQQHNIKTLLYPQPWNAGVIENGLIVRTKGWDDILEQLRFRGVQNSPKN